MHNKVPDLGSLLALIVSPASLQFAHGTDHGALASLLARSWPGAPADPENRYWLLAILPVAGTFRFLPGNPGRDGIDSPHSQ